MSPETNTNGIDIVESSHSASQRLMQINHKVQYYVWPLLESNHLSFKYIKSKWMYF